jgi:WD40 repeat protein
LVLSAAQDGCVKLWDIREPNSQQTMQSKAGPCRDVMWCPTNPYKYAVAFDSGVIQVWDVREQSNFELQLSSHHRDPVLTLAWHPVRENVLASGSRDKMIKIWNISETRSPMAEIQTIQSVARIKWRPFHSTQIASCSVLFDNRIHIWDYEAPYMPVASFIGHRDVVTGFVWGSGSGDELISCSKDSTARFFSVSEDAYLPQKHLKVGAVAWDGSNNIGFIDDHLKE